MKNLFFSFTALVLFMNVSFGQNKVTLEVAKQIGTLHNQYLKEGLNEAPKTISALNTNFMAIDVEGVPDEYKNQLMEYYAQNNMQEQEDLIFSNLESENSKELYNSTKNVILQAKNFADVSKELDAKLAEASHLSGKEQEILFTLIETSRSSLQFWLPKSQGGQDGASRYGSSTKINWGAIGYADGAGAVGALIRTFYLAAGGPLSWGAIVGAIGWGAAWGSGTALLYQLM